MIKSERLFSIVFLQLNAIDSARSTGNKLSRQMLVAPFTGGLFCNSASMVSLYVRPVPIRSSSMKETLCQQVVVENLIHT